MALIQCPECDGKVSDQAPACPHCGFPLAGAAASTSATAAASASLATADASGISQQTLSENAYPGKPFHWSDRIPVAFLLFWGGLLIGTIFGGSGDMAESLAGQGVQAEERTAIGRLAWAMVIAGIIWFVGKNALGYLHYRNWKINRLHQELIAEAERKESAR